MKNLPRTIDDEINKYLKLDIDTKIDSLKWWQQNASVFRRLSHLAKKFLAITAMSSAVESHFSIMGCIISARRSSLTPRNAEQLVFLHDNMKYSD